MRYILIICVLTFQFSFSEITKMLILTKDTIPDTEEMRWSNEFKALGLTVMTQPISNDIQIGKMEVLAMAHDFGSYHTAIMNVVKKGYPLLLLGEAMKVADDVALFNGKINEYVYVSGPAYMYKKGDYAQILSDYTNDQQIVLLDIGYQSYCPDDNTKFVGAWLSNRENKSQYDKEVLMGVCDRGVHSFNGQNGYTGELPFQVCVFGHSCGKSPFTSDFEKIFKKVFKWFEYKPYGIALESLGEIKALYR
ncbi:MAG: hypothetical protein ACUVWP_03710 [bacterium]